MLGRTIQRMQTRKYVKRELGVINPGDIERMAARKKPKDFGIDPASIPQSLPDVEDLARDARRRMLARRRGRMSTILTGGSLGSPDAALGG